MHRGRAAAGMCARCYGLAIVHLVICGHGGGDALPSLSSLWLTAIHLFRLAKIYLSVAMMFILFFMF